MPSPIFCYFYVMADLRKKTCKIVPRLTLRILHPNFSRITNWNKSKYSLTSFFPLPSKVCVTSPICRNHFTIFDIFSFWNKKRHVWSFSASAINSSLAPSLGYPFPVFPYSRIVFCYTWNSLLVLFSALHVPMQFMFCQFKINLQPDPVPLCSAAAGKRWG